MRGEVTISQFTWMKMSLILPQGSMANGGSTHLGSKWVAAQLKEMWPWPPLLSYGFEGFAIKANQLEKGPPLVFWQCQCKVWVPLLPILHLFGSSDKVKWNPASRMQRYVHCLHSFVGIWVFDFDVLSWGPWFVKGMTAEWVTSPDHFSWSMCTTAQPMSCLSSPTMNMLFYSFLTFSLCFFGS